MRMKNDSGSTLRIEALQLTVSPGAEVDIPDGYCLPRKGANGENQEPIIAMLAPQLIPANPELVAAYRANKLTENLSAEPVPPKRAADYQADGVAPAVAEMMASGAAASVPKVGPKGPTK
jgi:hypothetical protein